MAPAESLFLPGFAPGDALAEGDTAGDAWCQQHGPAERRPHGITLTPAWLVQRMLALADAAAYDTIVDIGAGTGRFAIAAALANPQARVLAVEDHPQMLALLRQRLAQAGLAGRVQVLAGDFRSMALPVAGRTLWLGNPPYVRHHDIPAHWKHWYRQGMAARGIAASQLAGLHAHFMLRAVQAMRPGDGLCLVTAAEWLDNGYGSALRALCTGPGPGMQSLAMQSLRLQSLWLADADQAVFGDALVSAAVLQLCADGGDQPARVGRLAEGGWQALRQVDQARLRDAPRWSEFAREHMPQQGQGPQLGELFHITRGQVTGMNQVWVLPPGQALLPQRLTVPAVTRAREIIDDALGTPAAVARLKRVVNLPQDLDLLASAERAAADAFLMSARRAGADQAYVARQRKPWHWLAMRAPPAALVSYMGRRPPVFRANPQQVSFLNIAHGLYPLQPLAADVLPPMLAALNRSVSKHSGRVYGGGLVKFEPSDIARLRLPADWQDSAA